MKVPSMTDEELLQAFADLGTARAVAMTYGVSYNGVLDRYHEAGLPIRRGRPTSRTNQRRLPSPWDTTWAEP